MSKHTITLPEPIADYIEQRVADGQYGSVSDYLAELVGRDMTFRHESVENLRALLDEAETSGISQRNLDDILHFARSPDRKSPGAV